MGRHIEPKTAETEYFANVTPHSVQSEWTPKDNSRQIRSADKIPSKYHTACDQLAAWLGTQTIDELAANKKPINPQERKEIWAKDIGKISFWTLCFQLLTAAQGWENYDWDADRRTYNDRKETRDRFKHIENLIRNISKSLASMRLHNMPPPAIFKVEQALAELHDEKGKIEYEASVDWCIWGPLFYSEFPRDQFPGNDVLVALYLSDLCVRLCRGDNSHLANRRQPDLKGAVPWAAIRHFAVAATNWSSARENYQTPIENAANSGVLLRGYWDPNLWIGVQKGPRYGGDRR